MSSSERLRITVLGEHSGEFAVWFEDLRLYGVGPDLSAALEDLACDIESYLADWFDRLQHATDHRQHAELVERLATLSPARLRSLIGRSSSAWSG